MTLTHEGCLLPGLLDAMLKSAINPPFILASTWHHIYPTAYAKSKERHQVQEAKAHHFPEGEATVVKEVSIGRVQANGMAEVSYSTLIVPAAIPGDASVVVGIAVLRVNHQSLCVVLHSSLILTNFVPGESPVEEGLEVMRL